MLGIEIKQLFSRWEIHCNEILSMSVDIVENFNLANNRYYDELAIPRRPRVILRKNIEDVLIRKIKEHSDMQDIAFDTLEEIGFEINGPAI